MTTPAEALAALTRTGAAHGPKPHRAVRHKSHGNGIDGRALTLPAPALLASVFVTPWLAARGLEPMRADRGTAFLIRPLGSSNEPTARNLVVLAEELTSSLAALDPCPARAERTPMADDPYTDVRLFAAFGPRGAVAAYMTDVLRAVRRGAPTWRPPRTDAATKPPAKTPQENARAFRERRRSLETQAAAEWLALTLDAEADDRLVPGDRVRASALWSRARADMECRADEADDLDESYAAPGRNRFYEVTAHVLGRPRLFDGVRTFVVPNDTRQALASAQAIQVNGHSAEALTRPEADVLAE